MKIKKFLVSSVVLIALTLSTAAFAQVKEFGPSFYRFTVDIPEGWTATVEEKPLGSAVGIINQKQDSILGINIQKDSGMPLKEIIEAVAKEFTLVDPVIKKDDDGGYSAVGWSKNGLKCSCTVDLLDGKVIIMAMGGKDVEALNKMVDSLQEK